MKKLLAALALIAVVSPVWAASQIITLSVPAKEVGNAAGNGAVSAALSQEAWKRALDISGNMRYIELASYPHFNEMYVEHMNF